jgi:hypothetical protein
MERNRKSKWYLDFTSRLRMSAENPLTEAVQEVLDRLSTAEATRGNDFKLVVCDDICSKSLNLFGWGG